MVNMQDVSSRRNALREALVASAQRIIGERGYQALRARDVARDVGCALGAIYGVFADLDALVLAVKERTLDMFEEEIAKRVPSSASLGGDDAPGARESAGLALLALAELYLAFASEHPKLWQAVFEHRSPDPTVPDSYMAKLDGLLRNIEHPLEILAPRLGPPERRLYARALFSAVHGVAALGLDQKLGPLSAESLEWQVRTLVVAAAAGISTKYG